MSEEFEPYRLPDPETHPAVIAARVLEMPEHAHLKDNEARIEFLMRVNAKIKGGRQVLGTAYMPTCQGELRDMFEWMVARLFGEFPDFLIVLDLDYWEAASAEQREILVFHELSHCIQKDDIFGCPKFTKDGLPVWGLRGHDVEEFTSVVRRYGAWNDELRSFIAAASQ